MNRLLVLGAASLMILAPIFGDDKAAQGPIAFTLPDVHTGKAIALNNLKERKAVVVVFTSVDCPINVAYLPTLVKLAQQYEPKGVQFLAINSNRVDEPAAIAEQARKFELPFPVLKDSNNKVADLFGAKRTPEAFILDSNRAIRYRGRIDDQFGIGFRRREPTTRDLAEALDAVLAGKAPPAAQTEVAGCLITRAAQPKKDATVTFTRDVLPILQKNCQECHRPGQIGPMPLLTYEQAEGWSAMIREVVAAKRMPPWFADPKIGHFLNDRSLPEKDREAILAWVDQGCPKGDEKDAPPAVQFPEGWRIGKPDAIFEMKEPYSVPAEMPKGGIPYRYFTLDTNFDEDKWIERAEARPGSPEVVHHIIAFVVPPVDSAEPTPLGPPLLPALVPAARKATVLCGTAPGDMPTIMRPGYAKKIPKGAKIVLQMHYTPNGRAQNDRSKIGLIFAKKPTTHQVLTVPVLQYRFEIPPGDANFQVESLGPSDLGNGPAGFDRDVEIIGFMPHMHLRGKDFFVEAYYPDPKEAALAQLPAWKYIQLLQSGRLTGRKEPLLSVPQFNFNWQNLYRLEKPLAAPKGTMIHCVAHFDNSADNPNNPDPKTRVRWGDQTWQEMMVGWTDYAIKR
jgi:peroxiredoxin